MSMKQENLSYKAEETHEQRVHENHAFPSLFVAAQSPQWGKHAMVPSKTLAYMDVSHLMAATNRRHFCFGKSKKAGGGPLGTIGFRCAGFQVR